MAVPADQVNQVAGLIQQAFRCVNDAAVQQHVNEVLQKHAADPQFNMCLLEIATSAQIGDEVTRAQAAYKLNENTRRSFKQAVEPNLAVIKQRLVEGLQTAPNNIRTALASCISQIAKTGQWPDLVVVLWQHMSSQDVGFRVGILKCIKNMCEDCGAQLEEKNAGNGKSQAEVLIPELMKLVVNTQHIDEVIEGVAGLYHLLNHESFEDVSPINLTFTSTLQQMLSAMEKAVGMGHGSKPTNAKEAELVKVSLNCLRLLVIYYYPQLKAMGAVDPILSLCYESTESQNQDVALAGCEFWLAILMASQTEPDGQLKCVEEIVSTLLQRNLLPKLASLLLNKMVFSEEEINEIMDEEESPNVLPKSWKKKKKKDRGDGGDEGTVSQWTVRQCASETLDALAFHAGNHLLNPPGAEPDWFLMKELLPRLNSSDWRTREVGVMALGAVLSPMAQNMNGGCYQFLEPHFAKLFRPLVDLLSNPQEHFLVRTITAWMLSLIVPWMFQQPTGDCVHQYFAAVMEAMTVKERKCQYSAVSAFLRILEQAVYEKQAGSVDFVNNPMYFNAILDHYKAYLTHGQYTMLNVTILLESIWRGFVPAFSQKICSPAGEEKLLSPIVEMTLRCQPDDDLLPQLLLTVKVCIDTLGAGFAKYIPRTYEYLLNLVGKHFEIETQRAQGHPDLPDISEPAKMACETLSSLIGVMMAGDAACKQQIQELLGGVKYPGTDYTFFDLILMPLSNPTAEAHEDILQSSLGFVGDHLSTFTQHLLPSTLAALPNLLPLTSADAQHPCAYSVAWFFGDVALMLEGKVPAEQITQFVGHAANGIIKRMQAAYYTDLRQEYDGWSGGRAEWLAISVGKFAFAQPALLAPQLGSFYTPLLTLLERCTYDEGYMAEDVEKALLGVARMLEANFDVLQCPENILLLAQATWAFQDLERHPLVFDRMMAIFLSLKQKLGAVFQELLPKLLLPPSISQKL